MSELLYIVIFIVSLCAFMGYRLTSSPYFMKRRIKDKQMLYEDMFTEKEHWRQKFMQLERKVRVNLDPEKAKDVNAAISDILNQFGGSDPRLAKLLNNPKAMDFALGLAKKFPKEAEQVISAFITKIPQGKSGQQAQMQRL